MFTLKHLSPKIVMGTSVFPEIYTSHVIILFKFTLIEAGCLFDADSDEAIIDTTERVFQTGCY